MKNLALLKAQSLRRDVSRFESYFNGQKGVPFALPANGTLAVRAIGAQPQQVALNVNGREVSARSLRDGELCVLGWFERAQVVACEAAYDLLVDTGLGKYIPIGESSGGGVNPPLPPGPLDFSTSDIAMTEYAVPFTLATPNAIVTVAYQSQNSNPTMALSHGGEPLTLLEQRVNGHVVTAMYLGSGLTTEEAELKFECPTLFGPVIGRVNDDFGSGVVTSDWTSGGASTGNQISLLTGGTEQGGVKMIWATEADQMSVEANPSDTFEVLFEHSEIHGDQEYPIDSFTPHMDTWTETPEGWWESRLGSGTLYANAQNPVISTGAALTVDCVIPEGGTLSFFAKTVTGGYQYTKFNGPHDGELTRLYGDTNQWESFSFVAGGSAKSIIKSGRIIQGAKQLTAKIVRSKALVDVGQAIGFKSDYVQAYSMVASKFKEL